MDKIKESVLRHRDAVIALRRHLRDGEPYDIELRLQRPDGGLRWVQAGAQHGDAAGDGGLCGEQPLGRHAEVAQLGQQHKGFQKP